MTGGVCRRAVVAFGSNIAPREEYLARALEGVCGFPRTRLAAAGEVEETEPVGVAERYRDMKFLNRLAIFESELEPLDFSRRMHALEDALGRVRTGEVNAPRTIDIDLVDYGGVRMESEELTLPHPRAAQRDFIMRPWTELGKKLLRAEMKRRRAAVPAEERARKSGELCRKLAALAGDAKTVCCYRALATELDLSGFIDECRERGVEVVFPESDGARPASYSVPKNDRVDLWICPGLAFTAGGGRVGFGGGWYDRFLAAAAPGSRAYGVAYAFQMVESVPQGPHDRLLDGVVTV